MSLIVVHVVTDLVGQQSSLARGGSIQSFSNHLANVVSFSPSHGLHLLGAITRYVRCVVSVSSSVFSQFVTMHHTTSRMHRQTIPTYG